MGDPIADRFGSLDYPGRRKPSNRDTPLDDAVRDSTVWDGHPIFYKVAGEKREFFTISHVAKALGYSVHSIRLWEDKGLLPRSPFRSPRARGPMAAGSTRGRRLWTREQVEGILRLARRHAVILNRKPPTAAFARDVKALFDRLTPST